MNLLNVANLFNRLYGGRHLALRLGNAYVPRQDPHGEAGVVAIFCGQVARGETPALIAATHYAGDEAVFNIGTGNATAVGGLLDVINAAAGTIIEPRFAPARCARLR